MTFHPEMTDKFMAIFDDRKELIGSFPGCSKVELLSTGNIFFTYSIWESEDALETYRKSELFQTTWSLVKPLFCAKAEAWSLQKNY